MVSKRPSVENRLKSAEIQCFRRHPVFFDIYFVIWLSQYWTIKKRVMQMNEKVQKEGADR